MRNLARCLLLSQGSNENHRRQINRVTPHSRPAGKEYRMRITAIEIENFKGISERVRVDLKPITLLFGANSAGKSTILQALLYMKDVLDRRNLDAISTPVSGRALDLGGFRSFVHGQDLSRTIKIWVQMEVSGPELPTMARTYKLPGFLGDDAEKRIEEFYETQWRILETVRTATVEIEVRWDQAARCPVAFAYTVGLNGENWIRIQRSDQGLTAPLFDLLHPALSRPCTTAEEASSQEILEDEDEDPNRPPKRALTPDELSKIRYPLLGGILPLFTGRRGSLVGIKRNWLTKPLDPIPDFCYREDLDLPEAVRGDYRNDCITIADFEAWEGTEFLARLLVGPGKLLQDWLQGLRYVGPLRARPPRKGIPSAELSDWSEGLAAWKTLEDEDTAQNLIVEVSQWLVGKDRLNSGYGLERRHLAVVDADAFRNAVDGDLDRAQLLELLKEAPKSAEVKLVEARSGLRLDPSDVGVGISQVLPIVVGAVAPGGSVMAIEQPELHIHPAMQVALGDLFIEGATKRGMSFLIETHSEHLILRLMRRIREGSISPTQIVVVFVEPVQGGRRFVELGIDEEGDFIDEWPGGFFEESFREKFSGR
jgi:predicted ATPase